MNDELTQILFVRMTEKEREAVHKAAKRDNFRSDSEWVRHALRDAAAKKT